MKASTSRVIYCAGLFLLAACAVMPQRPPQAMVAATIVSAPQSPEVRLAQAMRHRIEVEIAYGARHPEFAEAREIETALRELAFADDARATRGDLIDALADELSDALAIRSTLPGADSAARADAEQLIRRLTAAINREVHSNRA
jgi:hypothetical protein